MAVRYVANSDFVVADKKGRRRLFKRNHRRQDGTIGYLPEEITGLYRDHLRMFKETTVDGEDVEQATAAPGEKRSVPRKKKSTPKAEPKEPEDGSDDEDE